MRGACALTCARDSRRAFPTPRERRRCAPGRLWPPRASRRWRRCERSWRRCARVRVHAKRAGTRAHAASRSSTRGHRPPRLRARAGTLRRARPGGVDEDAGGGAAPGRGQAAARRAGGRRVGRVLGSAQAATVHSNCAPPPAMPGTVAHDAGRADFATPRTPAVDPRPRTRRRSRASSPACIACSCSRRRCAGSERLRACGQRGRSACPVVHGKI